MRKNKIKNKIRNRYKKNINRVQNKPREQEVKKIKVPFVPLDPAIKVSVVMAVYNGEKFLKRCLDSILQQSLREIEIICVDDGSTDTSGALLDGYSRVDNRVKVLHIPNGGAGAARNLGMRYARGEYLSFLDADDFFERDMLKKAYSAAERHSCDIVLFGCDLYDQQANTFRQASWTVRREYIPEKNPFNIKDIPDYIFEFTQGWAWDKIFRNRFVRDNGLKFLEQNIFEDAHFVCSACAVAKNIYFLDEVFAHYRINTSGSLSRSKGKYVKYVPNAFRSIKNRLINDGQYEYVKRGFINRVGEAFFDVFLNTEGKPREVFYNNLKNQLISEFELVGHDKGFYFKKHVGDFFAEVDQLIYTDYLSVRVTRVENNYKKAVADKEALEDKLNLQVALESNRQLENRDELLAKKVGKMVLFPYFMGVKAIRSLKTRGLSYTIKRILFGKKHFYSKDINVCFVTDEGFSMPTAVTITSILKNRSKRYNYNVYVVGHRLSASAIEKIQSISAKNFTVNIIEVNNFDVIDNNKLTSSTIHVTPTALLKFFLADYLIDIDKVLYLDGDMIVQSDLSNLYNIDINDRYAAVVKDIAATFAWHRKAINYQEPSYFNSGMMLLNLKALRDDEMSKKLLDYRLNGKNVYMDQDALNVVFGSKVRYISPYYNFINKFLYQKDADWLSTFYDEIIYRDEIKCYKKAEIIHFASQVKPWNGELTYLTNLFKKYYSISPYAGRELYTTIPEEYEWLKKINNFNDYLKAIEKIKEELVLAMAIKDDGSVQWDEIVFPEYIKNTELRPRFRNGYVYVRDFSENYFFEDIGKNYVEHKYIGKEVSCTVKSQGAQSGKSPSFEFVVTPIGYPNVKVTKNKHRGLNVIVYSKKCYRIVDDFSVDTFADKDLNIDRTS